MTNKEKIASHRKAVYAWRRRNPDAANAYTKIYRAKKGMLIYPQICECCHHEFKATVGHHFDYDTPLDVTWLCLECHRAVHFALRNTK